MNYLNCFKNNYKYNQSLKMLENRDVYEVIEEDQYCLHVSVFKCMNTKIEKLKKELISSVHYNVEQLQKSTKKCTEKVN